MSSLALLAALLVLCGQQTLVSAVDSPPSVAPLTQRSPISGVQQFVSAFARAAVTVKDRLVSFFADIVDFFTGMFGGKKKSIFATATDVIVTPVTPHEEAADEDATEDEGASDEVNEEADDEENEEEEDEDAESEAAEEGAQAAESEAPETIESPEILESGEDAEE